MRTSNVRREFEAGGDFPALIIAGPTDSTYAKEMMALASKLKADDVHFCGMLRGNEKWGALYSCEAFILPSHQENFGIAVVEALACGRPVLISDQVNIFTEIKSEGAGLIASDDLEGACSLLKRWIQLPLKESDAMVDATCRCYESYFLPSTAADALASVLSGGSELATNHLATPN